MASITSDRRLWSPVASSIIVVERGRPPNRGEKGARGCFHVSAETDSIHLCFGSRSWKNATAVQLSVLCAILYPWRKAQGSSVSLVIAIIVTVRTHRIGGRPAYVHISRVLRGTWEKLLYDPFPTGTWFFWWEVGAKMDF